MTAEERLKIIQTQTAFGASLRDCCEALNCRERELTTEEQAAIKTGRIAFKKNLRLMQWTKASNGDNDMLKWLGKQHLGQR